MGYKKMGIRPAWSGFERFISRMELGIFPSANFKSLREYRYTQELTD